MTQKQFGLCTWDVEPRVSHPVHQHNDIEMIYVERGSVSYSYHAQVFSLHTGDWLVFWAAIPHQLLQCNDGCKLRIVTIPLTAFLQWALPDWLVNGMMDGEVLIRSQYPTQFSAVDVYFRQWQHDLELGSVEGRELVLLEAQAVIRRLSLYYTLSVSPQQRLTSDTVPASHAQAIARYIAGHYTQPITLNTIAAAVGLRPSYASSLFRDYFAMTIWEYLTQYRVAHAQRLLLQTNDRIETIASAAGFTSISQFYAMFRRICLQSPKQFRHATHELNQTKNTLR